jgi:transcriptional regulator with XRE-family HTH domain
MDWVFHERKNNLKPRRQFHERVGKKIKEIREKCGVDIETLSASSGISQNALNSIEKQGRDIKVSELYAISIALNVRITAFLRPCDSSYYKKKQEENIECYLSAEKVSDLLDIPIRALKELYWRGEIPCDKKGTKYFFRASEINDWLKHHFCVEKRIKKKNKQISKIFGLEPLVSTKDATNFLGCNPGYIYGLRSFMPYYKIGGRYRYRLSDIVNHREKARVEPWNITTRLGTWRSSYVKPELTQEEKMLKDAGFNRGYSEYARPGYIVREARLYSSDFEDLKLRALDFMRNKIIIQSNILSCHYFIIERRRMYGCDLRWWGLPDEKRGYEVITSNLSSDDPDDLRLKVIDYVRNKIPRGKLIDVQYYSWDCSWDPKPHHAKIQYYQKMN